MKVVILAAGKGTRMKSNTNKTLIKIKGKTILNYSMDLLLDFVDEFIFVIGHKGSEVKEEIGINYKGKEVKYVIQEEQLGTGHALYQAKDLVNDKFINLNGDDIYSLEDIKECLKYELAVLTTTVKDPENYGVVIQEDGYLKTIVEKPKEFISDLITTGLYVFTPQIFDELNDIISNDKKSDRGEFEVVDAATQLAKKKKFKVVKVKGYWFPHNKMEDVKKTEEFFKNHK